MTRQALGIWTLVLALLTPLLVHAGTIQLRNSNNTITELKGTSGAAAVTLDSLISGEDQTNNVMRVEGQFSYKKIPHADTQVKASAGFIHTLSCVSDAAATAGSIILYDNTAESGTEILNMTLGVALYQFSLVLDTVFTTGLYVGFTTTADVDCVVSYR